MSTVEPDLLTGTASQAWERYLVFRDRFTAEATTPEAYKEALFNAAEMLSQEEYDQVKRRISSEVQALAGPAREYAKARAKFEDDFGNVERTLETYRKAPDTLPEEAREMASELADFKPFLASPEPRSASTALGNYEALGSLDRERKEALMSGIGIMPKDVMLDALDRQLGIGNDPDIRLSLEEETEFQRWFSSWAEQLNLSPNPDDRRHFYKWRAAWKAGSKPDSQGHWPSEFKMEGHPNLVVDGKDTRTGRPVSAALDERLKRASSGLRRRVEEDPDLRDQLARFSRASEIYTRVGAARDKKAEDLVALGLAGSFPEAQDIITAWLEETHAALTQSRQAIQEQFGVLGRGRPVPGTGFTTRSRDFPLPPAPSTSSDGFLGVLEDLMRGPAEAVAPLFGEEAVAEVAITLPRSDPFGFNIQTAVEEVGTLLAIAPFQFAAAAPVAAKAGQVAAKLGAGKTGQFLAKEAARFGTVTALEPRIPLEEKPKAVAIGAATGPALTKGGQLAFRGIKAGAKAIGKAFKPKPKPIVPPTDVAKPPPKIGRPLAKLPPKKVERPKITPGREKVRREVLDVIKREDRNSEFLFHQSEVVEPIIKEGLSRGGLSDLPLFAQGAGKVVHVFRRSDFPGGRPTMLFEKAKGASGPKPIASRVETRTCRREGTAKSNNWETAQATRIRGGGDSRAVGQSGGGAEGGGATPL
jgi:hypothetical protein